MKLKSLVAYAREAPQHLRAGLHPRGLRAWLLVASLLILAVGGSAAFWWHSTTTLPGDAAFRYNDRVVTVEELDQRMNTIQALYGVEPPDTQDKTKTDAFRRDTAKAVAVSLILDDAAEARGIVIAEKVTRDTLTKFIAEHIGEGPDARDRFINALGTVGASERAVLDEIRRQLSSARLFDDVTQGIEVGDEEVGVAYQDRKDELGEPERRQISNIVVTTEDDAKKVLRQLRDGTPFSALAQEWSLDSATREEGGNLGFVSAEELDEKYATAAFGTEPGDVFGPVETEHGWNVGQVHKVRPAAAPSFAQAEEDLKQTLKLEKAVQKWRAWLVEQIRKADVEYADEFRPAEPDSPPVHAPASAGR